MLSKELEYTRKPDGGLAEHIEVLEAFADGDADNTELLMLLIELRSLREQLAELKALQPVAGFAGRGKSMSRWCIGSASSLSRLERNYSQQQRQRRTNANRLCSSHNLMRR
ncbi:TPA: hypothetical protein PXQ47_001263 [Yersinia enterocolitica]|nr:hypothetical protein [Yersinia enterocolitica]